jgi:hypothetical protein
MGKNYDNHLQELEKELVAANTSLRSLSKRNEIEKIIELIKVKKGWTTPAELAFAREITTSFHSRLEQISKELSAFEAAAKQVRVEVEIHN